MRFTATKWNKKKPVECPTCRSVAIDLEPPSEWKVYTCCSCGTRFARFPRLAMFLPEAGVMCKDHRSQWLRGTNVQA